LAILRIPVGKLHNDRYVPLHPQMKTMIDQWLSTRPDWQNSPLLFTDGGRPIPGTRVDHAIQTAAAAAGIGHVHAHQLRHTLATQAINRGMSLEAISALLGHKTMTMTLVYANPRELHQTGVTDASFRVLAI
jgi:integrase